MQKSSEVIRNHQKSSEIIRNRFPEPTKKTIFQLGIFFFPAARLPPAMIKPEDGEAGEDISSWDGHFWIYLKIT
jgi:hypothetical protein